MKSKSYICLGLATLAILTTTGCSKKSDDKGASDLGKDVMATVNGTPISKPYMDRFIVAMKREMPPTTQDDKAPGAAEKIQKDALNKMIRLELLYQESQAKGIKIKDEDVNKITEGLRKNFPDDASFKKALAEGQTNEENLKNDVRRNLAVEELINKEVLDKLVVTDEDCANFYKTQQQHFQRPESVHVSHILVKVDKTATPEQDAAAKKKIEDIKKRLNKGEDFAKIATAESDCPSGKTGGDLSFVFPGRTVPEFEKCAFALEKPNQVSDIVKTMFGYHIIKLMEKRPAGLTPYEEAVENIKRYIKNQKLASQLETYVQQIKTKAKIESIIDLTETVQVETVKPTAAAPAAAAPETATPEAAKN